jgi:hypothetical protein
MPNAPFNRLGQFIKSDVVNVQRIQSFIAHCQVSAANAVAANAAGVLVATALTAAAQAIIAGITNPGVPRNVSITGNASGIAGNVVVKGTNFAGVAITDTIALNGTATVQGVKAFKTVTEVDLPIKTNSSGDTVSVGLGSALGLAYLLPHNTVLKTYLNNVLEVTAPTVATSTTNIESNTITLASALNGSIVDIYLMV